MSLIFVDAIGVGVAVAWAHGSLCSYVINSVNKIFIGQCLFVTSEYNYKIKVFLLMFDAIFHRFILKYFLKDTSCSIYCGIPCIPY